MGQVSLGPYTLDTAYHGDCRELTPAIPDASVDLIFTDPPYAKKYLPLYRWLAKEASRILTDDGFLLTYVGGYWKDDVMASLRKHLRYYWDFTCVMGESTVLWQRKVVSRAKSILAYRRKGGNALPFMHGLGLWNGGVKDKRYHTWGQNESAVRYYMQMFSPEGGIVLDPMVGGGVVPAMATITGRRWLAFDTDPDAITATIRHVADATDVVKRYVGNDSYQLHLWPTLQHEMEEA